MKCKLTTLLSSILLLSCSLFYISAYSQNREKNLAELNKYLKTFDNGYYGSFEIKGDSLYVWFSGGKFDRMNINDLEGAVVTKYNDVHFKCYGEKKNIYSSWSNKYENYMLFSSSANYDRQSLVNLLNNFVNSYKKQGPAVKTPVNQNNGVGISSPLIEALKTTEIKSDTWDMNDPRFKNYATITKTNGEGFYSLIFDHITPKENAFLFRTLSEERDRHTVKFTGFNTPLKTVKSYTSSSSLNACYALDVIDSAQFGIMDSVKFKFTLLTANVPLVHLEDLKDKSFEEALLTLAYSAKFNFINVLRNSKAAYSNSWNYGIEGLLIKDKTYHFNSGGSFFQTIDEEFDDNKKAIALAKKYAAKIEEALKGISFTSSECSGKEPEKCYQLMGLADNVFKANYTYAYVKTFSVAPPAGTVFFNQKQKSLFTIKIYVETEESNCSIEIIAE